MAYIEPNDPFLKGENTNCIFCHGPAVAYWHCSDHEVCICCHCATTILPLLIADAVTAKDPKANLNAVLETITANFYRGVAKGLQRLHKPAHRRKPAEHLWGAVEV